MVHRVLSFDSPLILTYKIHFAAKIDALKWNVFKGDPSYSIGGTLYVG